VYANYKRFTNFLSILYASIWFIGISDIIDQVQNHNLEEHGSILKLGKQYSLGTLRTGNSTP